MPEKRSIRLRNPAGRPAASLGRDARDSLLTAAVELFAEQGVAATTFSNIAARAGLTPAMMHYYFKNRNQLLDAAVAERMVPLIASVWDPIQENDGNQTEMVRAFIERLLDGIQRMPWIPPVWIREVLNEGGLLRSRVLHHIPREKVRIFYETVARGQNKGTVNRDIEPLLLVFSTLGLVMVHCATLSFVSKVFQREPFNPEILERHITALVLDGIKPRIELVEVRRRAKKT